jgi:hypothetical protein
MTERLWPRPMTIDPAIAPDSHSLEMATDTIGPAEGNSRAGAADEHKI